ncbi:hypothetical protein ACIA5H_08450 [Nocardia sp. NPDC051900]|uniref:hypothetical protein n=1 Tax=Nocardia sp. NPDC051900 TaxID=3364326 RepID=UPI00378D88F2
MFVKTLRSATPPLAAALLTVVTLGYTLHRGWILTQLWLLALPLSALAFLISIALFTLALWRARRDARRWPLAVTAVLAVIGLCGPVFLILEPEAAAWTRFQLERPAFAAAATVEVPEPGAGDYYGVALPRHLCFVSANCKVAVIGTSGGQPVRFVPDYVGIPDGAVGYGHFTGTPGAGPYDGFGDPICPTTELAGGWWWLTPCPEA